MELVISIDLPEYVDLLISHSYDGIPFFDPRLRRGISLLYLADHGFVVSDHSGQYNSKYQGQYEVKDGSCRYDRDPCPDRFIVEVVRRVCRLLIFSHRAESPDRQ